MQASSPVVQGSRHTVCSSSQAAAQTSTIVVEPELAPVEASVVVPGSPVVVLVVVLLVVPGSGQLSAAV